MIDAKEVNRLLAQEVESFCREFLSAGKEKSGRWYVGSARNDAGESFVIDLRGAKQGVWADFDPAAGVKPGSMLDLWMLCRGCDFRTAFQEAKAWLSGMGVLREGAMKRVEAPTSQRRETAAPGKVLVDWKPISEGSAAFNYLVKERGIYADVLARYRVGEGNFWFPQFNKSVPGLAFPAYSADGKELLMVKYIALERPEGKKVIRSNKAAVFHLVGMHAVDPAAGHLMIAEGEIDMLSWASAGIANAVSVPFGASDIGGRLDWVDNDWDFLEGFQDVIPGMDGDAAGKVGTAALLQRLGNDRCSVLAWPNEDDDANEVFQRDPMELIRVFDNRRAIDPDELKRAGHFRQEVWERFFPPGGEKPGSPCPWPFPFRFRPGELTGWTGYNKHGKTVNLTYCLTYWASLGQPCCVASLEMPAPTTLHTMVRQCLGRSRPVTAAGEPDQAMFDLAMRWLNKYCFVYDKVGEVDLADVLRVFRYAARRYGVKHFVLDSLMKLNVEEDNYDRQKGIVNQLSAFAKETGGHVHLVMHSKKPGEKRPEEKYWPRKYDINGSAALSNVPDNIVAVYRNKQKEINIELAKHKNATRAEIEVIERAEPDALFLVLAQRGDDGSEPIHRLWFDVGGSWQYFDNYSDQPRVLVGK